MSHFMFWHGSTIITLQPHYTTQLDGNNCTQSMAVLKG